MNADEKAVAELFKCDCGYDEASATCFDSGHDLGCKSRHSDVGTALAARIRAEASGEVAALRGLLVEALSAIRAYEHQIARNHDECPNCAAGWHPNYDEPRGADYPHCDDCAHGTLTKRIDAAMKGDA